MTGYLVMGFIYNVCIKYKIDDKAAHKYTRQMNQIDEESDTSFGDTLIHKMYRQKQTEC